jgi:hypothetical protein
MRSVDVFRTAGSRDDPAPVIGRAIAVGFSAAATSSNPSPEGGGWRAKRAGWGLRTPRSRGFAITPPDRLRFARRIADAWRRRSWREERRPTGRLCSPFRGGMRSSLLRYSAKSDSPAVIGDQRFAAPCLARDRPDRRLDQPARSTPCCAIIRCQAGERSPGVFRFAADS